MDLGEAARALWGCGLSVIPLAERGKMPRVRWRRYQGELPSEGAVLKWWSLWPESNVGLVTGQVSGVVVVDFDEGGEEQMYDAHPHAMDELISTPTVCAVTPKGHHYYYEHPGSGIVIPNTSNAGLHVDLRGDGGYVVAPPSINRDGHDYEWVEGCSPFDDCPLAPLPDWHRLIVPGGGDEQETE